MNEQIKVVYRYVVDKNGKGTSMKNTQQAGS